MRIISGMATVGWVSFSWMADLVGQVVQRAVLVQVVLQDVGDGRCREEVLLAQTQDLALGVVVVGVQDLGDQLGAEADRLMAVL